MLNIQGEVDTVRTWVTSPVLQVYLSERNSAVDPKEGTDDSICWLGHLNLGIGL